MRFVGLSGFFSAAGLHLFFAVPIDLGPGLVVSDNSGGGRAVWSDTPTACVPAFDDPFALSLLRCSSDFCNFGVGGGLRVRSFAITNSDSEEDRHAGGATFSMCSAGGDESTVLSGNAVERRLVSSCSMVCRKGLESLHKNHSKDT